MALTGLLEEDRLPASPGPFSKVQQISSLLSIRLNYELSDWWDIYMNQKMKIA